MSKQVRKPLSIALGTAIVASLGATGIANAEADTDADLFSMQELNSGYLIAGNEGSCGEGKCGDDKKDGEGSCGEDGGGEGSCGGGEGSCGSS